MIFIQERLQRRLKRGARLISQHEIKTMYVTKWADRIVYLGDIARVWRGYPKPSKLVRYNGEPAIALGVSGILGSNIVKVGQAVSATRTSPNAPSASHPLSSKTRTAWATSTMKPRPASASG